MIISHESQICLLKLQDKLPSKMKSKKSNFHLKPSESFSGHQLPTNSNVLQRFFWLPNHECKNQSKQIKALKFYNERMNFNKNMS